MQACLVCRVRVAPLVCKKWCEALRQPSCAWESIHIDGTRLRKSKQVFPRLSWAEQRCSSTTTATVIIGTETVEQLLTPFLTKLPALKRLSYGQSLHSTCCMGPFGSLPLCPHLTHVFVSIAKLHQGHLDLLTHLKHLQVLVVHGAETKPSPPRQSFPGQLSDITTLRTLYINRMCTGIHEVSHAISKLSSLEELHLVDCEVCCVSSGLLHLSQLSALQISNSPLDGQSELVLPDLSVLPKLTNVAVRYGLDDFPGQLVNCTRITSLSFRNKSECALPVGPYLKNLSEIAVDGAVKMSVFKEVTNLQRLSCLGVRYDRHILSTLETDADLRLFAHLVPNLKEMSVSYLVVTRPQAIQKCIFLNQLLIKNSSGPQSGAVLQVGYKENQLPWTLKAQFCESSRLCT